MMLGYKEKKEVQYVVCKHSISHLLFSNLINILGSFNLSIHTQGPYALLVKKQSYA